MNSHIRKVIPFSIPMVCVVATVVLQGCVTYYVPPELPNSQMATICGTATTFNRQLGEVSALGIIAVDSVRVRRVSGGMSAGFHSEEEISRYVVGDLTASVQLMPGWRVLQISYRQFAMFNYYHLKNPMVMRLNCRAGHKYEARFKKISDEVLEVWIVDLQTKEKQALQTNRLVRK